MKTRFYKLSLPFLLIAVLASCMKSETEPVSMPVSGEADLEFSYSVPDYTVVRTKSAESTVNDISLLQFDADGRFLGRSVASDLQGGTFKAKVSGSTRIVHFIANYDWSAFDERGSLGKDERTLVPDLESDTWVLWNRKTVDNFNAPPQVRLLRNQAKVTVEIDQNLLDLMAQGQREQFTVEGFALYNYATRGTIAPFSPGIAEPFEWAADRATVPADAGMCADKPTTLDLEPKYMFESDNGYNDETFVILHAGGDYKKYYKIELIDSELNLYPIVRNTHFRIRIMDYIPGNIGSGSAASSLSEMLGKTIEMKVPNVCVLEYQQIIDAMGGPEKVITGILVRLEGDIKGMMMFLLEDSFAQVVLSTFMNAENVQVTKLGDMELSVITEMGNIMAGSYLRALSTLTGLTIDMSIPSMTVDMLGAIMSVPITEFAQVGDKVLFIDDGFKIDGVAIKSNIILIPEMESLETLMKKLGVM